MSRPAKIVALCVAAGIVASATAACGTQSISVPTSQVALHNGAVIFSERCAGCHTLAAAATHGSPANIRTGTFISGPNFNQRCERTANGLGVDRVLYAIENGGFSGAYMPQNVVVGQDAVDVARFVATYAGSQIPPQVGVKPCNKLPVGTLPPGSGTVHAGSAGASASASHASTSSGSS
ncbi:MAG: c-type cytochrome [Solirubrobacteraceae bacterium]